MPTRKRSNKGGSGRRFAFPEVAERETAQDGRGETSLGSKGPNIVWPECGRPETAKACAELAEAIRWRLSANRPSVLAITSPAGGDGKTSVVIGLARELAHLAPGGVLAVDADPRGGGLTSRLSVTAETNGESSDATIWPTNVPGLSALPIIPSTHLSLRWHNPTWIAELRERWPLVLLDCPSLEHAETSAMLRACDGVYVVVRLGHTSRRAVVEAGQVIQACGGRLLGCIAVA